LTEHATQGDGAMHMRPGCGKFILVLLLFAAVLSGCSSSQEASRLQAIERTKPDQRSMVGALDGSASAEKGTAAIQPGDQIQVSVWGYPEFATTATVNEEGTIVVPLVGEIQAARLTKEQFTGNLKSRLTKYIKEEPRITVSVVSIAGTKVSVMGAVNKQDNYPVMGEVSLVEILSSAGGATPAADLSHVKIYRNGVSRNSIDVDLTKHMELGDMESLPRVRPGDTVFVPLQENLVRGLSDFVRDALVVFGFFRFLN
jgi:polysaccharide export outer membrane protein